MTDVSKLPQELKDIGLFCLWRYEQRGDKRTKVPYDPRTGRMAQSNDSKTFTSLETAMGADQQGYDGLGVGIFGDTCAIDIDHCVNEDGLFSQVGMYVMAIMDSYTEYSPSGKGLRILFKVPGFIYDKSAYYINNARLGLEIYVAGATSKYVTVTGNMVIGSDRTLRERGAELRRVLDRYMQREQYPQTEQMSLDGRQPQLRREIMADATAEPVLNAAQADAAIEQAIQETPGTPAVTEAPDDLRLLDKAIGSKGGIQFDALYHGNTQGYPSHSEADLALCCKLAFWTGCDKMRMDRMFRASGLMRQDKWDRQQSGSTYGAITIDRAVRDSRETYKPPAIAQAAAPYGSPALPQPIKEEIGHEQEPEKQETNAGQTVSDDSQTLFPRPWPVISGSKAPMPFPLDALPALGQAMVRSVTDSVQVPLDLPACFLLGALSTAVVGRAQVEPWPGYREPLQLFILASANPSERKSATMEALFGPIHCYQRQENQRRKPLISRSISLKEVAEQNLKRAITSGDSSGIDAAHRQLDELEEVHPFELIISDATTEAMAMCMARNEGRVALVSAEGGMLSNLCGRYSAQQSANVDVMLHGYSGEPMYQERVGRGSLQIERTAVSLCLAAQPGVVQTFLGSGAMNECGMVSRFLVSSPRTALGSRKLQGPPPDALACRAWEEKLHRLLDCQEQMLLHLSDDAAAMFDIWGEEIEQRLCPGRDLHDLAGGFGGKLRGNTARIAGLLRLLEGDDPEGFLPPEQSEPGFAHYRIEGRHMLGAVDIARYFLGHMMLQCGAEDISPEADTVLKLLVKMGVNESTTAVVRSKTRGHRGLDSAEQVETVFEELVKEGYIRLKVQQPVTNPAEGRRSKPLYELNPALTQPREPSVYQKELAQGMRRILSQDLQTYTQADETGKERMRKMYVSMQQKLE